MIKILQVGVGPLGKKIVKLGTRKANLKFVAAVDLNENLEGKDLGEVCEVEKLGVKIRNNLAKAVGKKKIDVAVLTTVSSAKAIAKQVEAIAKFGINIVTTCEELSYPWKRHKAIAKKLDEICKKHRVVCLATGVNPGFMMDYLPCALTSINFKVEKIKVLRYQNASFRRIPFQKKIGVGLTRKEFNEKVRNGIIRHVGLPESIDMIAACMNWKLDKVTETIKPVIAKQKLTNGFTVVEKGMVCGVEQTGKGYVDEKEVIRLHFRASIAEKEPLDAVEIKGVPNIKSVINGGVNGDVATSAITLNALNVIDKMTPGLKTMLDTPVPGCKE